MKKLGREQAAADNHTISEEYMAVTTADIKKLRDATGAGMMDAKSALSEADGDFDKAVESLRVHGAAKAAKRGAEREASAGLVANSGGALIELNSETDFVAKNEQFTALAAELAELADRTKPDSAEAFARTISDDGATVEDRVAALGGVIGEKVELGRVAAFDGQIASYMHRRGADLPPAVGVLVQYGGDDTEAARGVAMQIAAMRPEYLAQADVPAEIVEKERDIAEATAREEEKPEKAIPKIIEGRVNAFFKEQVLLDQPSVADNKKSVNDMLDEAGISIKRFARIEIGG